MDTAKHSQISNKSHKKNSASLKLISKIVGITLIVLAFFYSNDHNEGINENAVRNARCLVEYIPTISSPNSNVYHFSKNEYQEREGTRNSYSTWTSGETSYNGHYSEYQSPDALTNNVKTQFKNIVGVLKANYYYLVPAIIAFYLVLQRLGPDSTLLLTAIIGILYYIYINSAPDQQQQQQQQQQHQP
ncbi:Plasmodium exported protein, unknown function [Plasmodium vinckei vinckei]|uniref:Uncharacterized protein n=1 Tax=Plasmodium vinckei vinckei TaxID=54757 RepID=A0A449BZB5_PLAVN|nr:Plasmodium exported protein, unknown function [Plasmodium vinckei vinckei]KEG04415.1 hypothetical protein YYE_01321 [Plasmodium vinckei vinckei]VEV58783.1 Plasmodium exported protein, unknown function [Plasmodium vinckei vinckei]